MDFLNCTLVGIWLFGYFIAPFYIFTRTYFQLIPIYGNYYFIHKLEWNEKVNPQKQNIFITILTLSIFFSFIANTMTQSTNYYDLTITGLISISVQSLMIFMFEYKIHEKPLQFKKNTVENVNSIYNSDLFENSLITLKTFFTGEIKKISKRITLIEIATDLKKLQKVERKLTFVEKLQPIVSLDEAKRIYEECYKMDIISFEPDIFKSFYFKEENGSEKKIIYSERNINNNHNSKKQLIVFVSKIFNLDDIPQSQTEKANFLNLYFEVDGCKPFTRQDL